MTMDNGAAPQPPKAFTVVKLRPSRAATAWGRATDALVEAAAQEERDAEAAYQQAKARYQAARQEAHRIREIRQLVTVEGSPAVSEPTPKPATNSTVFGRWSRNYDACTNCGTTARKHAANGRCGSCDSYWRTNDSERPTEAQPA